MVGPDHLWWQVVQGAAHGLASVVGSVDRPAEIANLDFTVDADEDVLGLDVPVNDVLPVKIPQRAGHLRNVDSRLPLWEAALPPKVLVQLALSGELENEEYPLAVVEVSVQLEDVWMSEVALDLNLATHLLLDAVACLKLVLVQHLEGADEARVAFSGEVHAAELALAEGASNVEHAQVEGPRCGRVVYQRHGLALRLD